MKLNHAQRKHLIEKFNQQMKVKIAQMPNPANTFKMEIMVPCRVIARFNDWGNNTSPILDTMNPVVKDFEKSLTVAQAAALAIAKQAMIAYRERHRKAETLMGKFEEELLFSDGGLEEANALIAQFIKKF